jgi:dihydrofolate reductase
MSNVVVTEFVSLDGVTEAPEKWSLKYWNEEVAKFKLDELFAADALLLGRVTYEGFAAAWPGRTGDFADRMNGLPKHVATKTLDRLEWNNSRSINGEVPAEVSRLREGGGGDLLVQGSLTLANELLRHDLVDEYRILLYPVVLGSGKRLFHEGVTARLSLAEAKPMGPDVVLLRYRRMA